jgi:8-oxo-dGTP diphosphatase
MYKKLYGKGKEMGNKIITENMVGAFLIKEGKYLLMQRSSSRTFAPNIWSCIGGHMEPNEINNPFVACLREIDEEASIKSENIFNLKLRYIIIRQNKNIIKQSYVYFGDTNIEKLIETEEGKLYWINKEELLDRKYTATFTEMMKHYVLTPNLDEKIIIGIAGKENNKMKMYWSIVEDFE